LGLGFRSDPKPKPKTQKPIKIFKNPNPKPKIPKVIGFFIISFVNIVNKELNTYESFIGVLFSVIFHSPNVFIFCKMLILANNIDLIIISSLVILKRLLSQTSPVIEKKRSI
jgi:hypothetical protein